MHYSQQGIGLIIINLKLFISNKIWELYLHFILIKNIKLKLFKYILYILIERWCILVYIYSNLLLISSIIFLVKKSHLLYYLIKYHS
jgi:hypothetical protein